MTTGYQMKYGVLFSMLSLLATCFAIGSGGWMLLVLWPAISFGMVGLGYLALGHRVFGKRSDGSMSLATVTLLLPFLICLWSVWHVMRIVSLESAYDSLDADILIGRRLLSSELPPCTQTVVDLTAEFPEPRAVRSVPNYIAAPMLDASTLSPQELVALVSRVMSAEPPVFIHCAQGHGRTGLIAALILLARGDVETPDAAMEMVRKSRSLVGLNKAQSQALVDAAAMIGIR